MKYLVTTMIFLFIFFNVLGQKRAVKKDFPADEVINIWDNKTAPHSNMETEDETIKKHRIGHTSYLDLYIFRAKEDVNTGHCLV